VDSGPQVPPLIAGRYELVEELGRGGSAIVYAAVDLHEQRRVAVKILRPDVAASLGRERFLREIRIDSSLSHDNILPLLDSGAEQGWVFLVMPLIPQGTLREEIERERQLPLTRVVRVGAEIAAALAAAHAAGVIHRDVKPENILLQGEHAVLGDFGIAKAAFASSSGWQSTTGVVLGTPRYMSPEQSSGMGTVDGRSDLYSLGCVVYEMLTGEPVFSGTTAQVIARHMTDVIPPLRLMRPDAPAGMDPVLRRVLAKVPGDRYQTADEFRAALEATLTEDGASISQRGRVRRSRRWVVAGVVAASAAATAVMVMFAQTRSRDRVVASPPVSPPITDIAVRPFEDLSGDGSLQLIVRGLTLDLIGELATLSVVKVRSASSMAPFAGAAPDSIGRALRVGTVIEGSVQRARDSLLVSVRLIDAATGVEFESYKTYRTRVGVGRLLVLDRTIQEEVVRFLRARLGQEIRVTRQRAGTSSIEAWEHFQRASRLVDDALELERTGFAPGAMRVLASADSLFQAAEAADSRWRRPTLARGWTDLHRARASENEADQRSAVRYARAAIKLADRVISESGVDAAEAHELKGTALYRLGLGDRSRPGDARSLQLAESELRAGAVASNPHEARAWSTLSTLLRMQGRFSDANVAARQAYETDAFMTEASAVLIQLCSTAFDIAKPVEAAGWCMEGRKRFPAVFEFRYHLLQMMQSPTGPAAQADSAWGLFREMESAVPPGEWSPIQGGALMMVAGVLARVGLADSARRVIATARERGSAQTDLDVYEATARLALGDTSSALDHLFTFVKRHPDLRATVAGHPSFAGLRTNPRFEQLVGRGRQ
jgi:eukaryotic-like serine/threonine-protein kinase